MQFAKVNTTITEAAFYMVGGIDEVIEKADKLAKDSK